MLQDVVDIIRTAVSGHAAKDKVAALALYHRIAATPGFRDAANYVLRQLQKAGLDAHIETYPADYQTTFWTQPSFQEWDVSSATLHLVEPKNSACKLADYRELKMSLIQRSASFEGEVEVVLLEDGTQEAEYDGLDLTGKAVLSKGEVGRVHELAVEKHGAVGILCDRISEGEFPPVRKAMDLPDGRLHTRFKWTGRRGEKKCFGFALSPRQGQWLRDMLRHRVEEGVPAVKVRVHVDSRFYDGEMEIVTARIPGETDDEVVVTAHLCHPQPSANDNASGSAAILEAARTLHQLIARGDLPRPRRSIRFLWASEWTGSSAYLSNHERDIPRMIAGVNADMVGQDQAQTGSSFLLERPPGAICSFVSDLLERLREEIFDDMPSYTGLDSYSLFHYATIGFGGGSDNHIFCSAGVPMAMLIQWPDKFYHSSEDTLDKVDPEMLARASTLTGAFAFFVANAGKTEATWLAYEMQTRFQVRLAQSVQAQITSTCDSDGPTVSKDALEKLERRVAYAVERHNKSLASLTRLWTGIGRLVEVLGEEATELAHVTSKRAWNFAGERFGNLDADAEGEAPQEPDDWTREAAAAAPRRLYRGPVALGAVMHRLSPEERNAWHKLVASRPAGDFLLYILAEYWADGHHSVLDIVDRVEMETGVRDPELITGFFKVLHKLDLVEFEKPSA